MTKVEKIKTRLGLMDRLQWRRASQGFEARDREVVKLGQDLAPMDRGNGEERERSYDDMEWIISFKKDQAKPCLHLLHFGHITPCHVSYAMSSLITLYEHSINL